MLKVQNITFHYPNQQNDDPVIDNLNLDIEEGTFVSILGHSGCGKSTLLRIIAGLEKPDNGKVQCTDSSDLPNTAVVFQDYSLFPWMTAEKNIAFGIRQSLKVTKKEAMLMASDYLEKVGMSQEKEKYPCQLSGGMRQRVAIARAFAMDTQLLLMDEPFGALDIKTRYQMQDLLLNVWNGTDRKKTVIFVTHDVDEALLLSERVLFLKDGTISIDHKMNMDKEMRKTELMNTDEYQELRQKIEQEF